MEGSNLDGALPLPSHVALCQSLQAPQLAQTPPGLHDHVHQHEQELLSFLCYCHFHNTLVRKKNSSLLSKCQMRRTQVIWVLFMNRFYLVDLRDKDWENIWRSETFPEVIIIYRSLFSMCTEGSHVTYLNEACKLIWLRFHCSTSRSVTKLDSALFCFPFYFQKSA